MVDRVDNHLGVMREATERVTPIELILDVAFVLAFSEITAHVAREQSWLGLLDAVIILAMLWRGWLGFAWLTSITDPNSTAVRIAVFTAMSAFVVMALVIPDFGNADPSMHHQERLVYGFVGAQVVVRFINLFLGLRVVRGDERARGAVIGTSIGGVVSVALLFAGCSAGSLFLTHFLWTLAVIVDYVFPIVFIPFRWRLVAGRFAERHGLIVIIALGETIMSAGVGMEHIPDTDTTTLLLAVVSVVLLAALWGAYFDGTETAAEHALVSASAGMEQNTLASRAYSFLHLPIVAGAVLIALGPRAAIPQPGEPFESYIAGAFFGGLALFLLGHVGFEYLTTKRLNIPRLAVGLLMFSLIGFGMVRPAGESLVLATSVMAVLVLTQRILRGERFRKRTAIPTEPPPRGL